MPLHIGDCTSNLSFQIRLCDIIFRFSAGAGKDFIRISSIYKKVCLHEWKGWYVSMRMDSLKVSKWCVWGGRDLNTPPPPSTKKHV